MMRILIVLLALAFAGHTVQAQFVTTPPASKKAMVAEWIGLTKVKIEYHRPGVKGREGQVYGENALVPYNAPIPWRAGADENTTMYFENDVTINGQPLAAGKYGFYVLPTAEEWTLVFSHNNWSWGSYNYDESEDALRVKAKPQDITEPVEWLEYRFVNQADNSADIQLRWEKKKVEFTVGTDVHAVTKASIESELDGLKGFTWQGWNSAANYLLTADKDLETGLTWADNAVNNTKNFPTLSTKAQILEKLGRTADAKTTMEEALPLATMTELHFYARSLIQQEKPEEAMKIFKMNREKNPDDQFTTLVGLARGNMALGNYKEAAGYFKKAAPNAPQGQQQFYEGLAKQCEEKMTKG